MLTFAISLLLTLGAAFAVLVIAGMIGANRHAIVAALAGEGALGAGRANASHPLPPLTQARLRVGPLRHGRRAANADGPRFNPLRAAA